MTIRSWLLFLAASGALALVACSSNDSGSRRGDADTGAEQYVWPDAGPEPSDEVVADLATEPDAAEAAPDVTEPAPDVTEPAPDAVEPTPDVAAEDVAPDLPPPPDPPVITPGAHCTPGSGDPVTIYDLRDPACPRHPDSVPTTSPGLPVLFYGVVVTANFTATTKDTMFVQEEDGGPYSGISVYKGPKLLGDLYVGDRVDVEGEVTDFFGQLQVAVTGSGSVTKVDDGAPPAPFDIPHPSHVATDGPVTDAFQGVLLRVHNVTVLNTRPDCPKEWGEFSVSGDPWVPGFLGLRVDDMGAWTYEPSLGDQFATLTGPLAFTFNNAKIEPRDDADLAVTLTGAGGQTKCVNTGCLVADYNAATDTWTPSAESGALVIAEIQYNPAGPDTDSEWIELYNPGNAPVPLAGYTLSDCALAPTFQTTFASGSVPAHGVLVLGNSTDTSLNGGASVDVAYGTDFPLPNTVGTLLLRDPNGSLVDQVAYSIFSPWPAKAGRSIELRGAALDNTNPDNWATATTKYGGAGSYGSPGDANW